MRFLTVEIRKGPGGTNPLFAFQNGFKRCIRLEPSMPPRGHFPSREGGRETLVHFHQLCDLSHPPIPESRIAMCVVACRSLGSARTDLQTHETVTPVPSGENEGERAIECIAVRGVRLLPH